MIPGSKLLEIAGLLRRGTTSLEDVGQPPQKLEIWHDWKGQHFY